MPVNKYVKKAFAVDALQWTGTNEEEMKSFLGVLFLLTDEDNVLLIDTLEGQMPARIGDSVIRGVVGEFYPCRQDIFSMSYDQV